VPIVLKSGTFNLLEPSGPFQTCNGIALPLAFTYFFEHMSANMSDTDVYEMRTTEYSKSYFEVHHPVFY
jgi:hypothetical protein